MPKRDAGQFVDDLIAGKLAGLGVDTQTSATWEMASNAISNNYEFTEQELYETMLSARDRLEAAAGIPLTDEQLAALSGGKEKLSTGAIVGISAGSVVGGSVIAGSIAGGVLAAVVFK
jgi:hypothetical protein